MLIYMWRPLAFKNLPTVALLLIAGCGEGTSPLLEESSLPGLHGELAGLDSCDGRPTGPATGLIRLLSPSDSSVVMETVVTGSFELDVPPGIYQLEVAAFGAYPDRSFGALEFHDTLGYQLNAAYKLRYAPHALEVHFKETVTETRAIEILRKEGASPRDPFLFSTVYVVVSANTHASHTAEALVDNYPNKVTSAMPEGIGCPQ